MAWMVRRQLGYRDASVDMCKGLDRPCLRIPMNRVREFHLVLLPHEMFGALFTRRKKVWDRDVREYATMSEIV